MKWILACASLAVCVPARAADVPVGQSPLVKAAGAFQAFTSKDANPYGRHVPIPASAVSIWASELEPTALHERDDTLLVSYDHTAALFDLARGRLVERDLAPGCDADMAQLKPLWNRPNVLGPGVPRELDKYFASIHKVKPHQPAVDFAGVKWQSEFVLPQRFSGEADPQVPREKRGDWTRFLTALNQKECLHSGSARHTMTDGLAGNLVNFLAVADGVLWVSCIDIYDHEKKAWGAGGLCRWNPEAKRWETQEAIGGLPARFITMLESHGPDLWVGFRVGKGVSGDFIEDGMGYRVGDYGPVPDRIAVARLSAGKWSTFTYPSRNEKNDRRQDFTESPRAVWPAGENRWLLVSTISGGQYQPELDSNYLFTLLTPASGKTGTARHLDVPQASHQDSPLLTRSGHLVIKARLADEALARIADRYGIFVWQPDKDFSACWRQLDPESTLPIGRVTTAAIIDGELWLGGLGCCHFDSPTSKCIWERPNALGSYQPVFQIEQTQNGRVFVLFRPRAYYADWGLPGRSPLAMLQIIEFHPTDEERTGPQPFYFGISALDGGKWSMLPRPAAVDDQGRPQRIHPQHIQAIGNELFAQDSSGVYCGPDSWQRVCSGQIAGLMTSGDHQQLVIPRLVPQPTDKTQFGQERYVPPQAERGTYNPANKKLAWEDWPIPGDSSEAYEWDLRPGLHKFEAAPYVAGQPDGRSCRLPVKSDRTWGTSLASGDRDYWPRLSIWTGGGAIWLFADGLVVRLDQRQLEATLAAAN